METIIKLQGPDEKMIQTQLKDRKNKKIEIASQFNNIKIQIENLRQFNIDTSNYVDLSNSLYKTNNFPKINKKFLDTLEKTGEDEFGTTYTETLIDPSDYGIDSDYSSIINSNIGNAIGENSYYAEDYYSHINDTEMIIDGINNGNFDIGNISQNLLENHKEDLVNYELMVCGVPPPASDIIAKIICNKYGKTIDDLIQGDFGNLFSDCWDETMDLSEISFEDLLNGDTSDLFEPNNLTDFQNLDSDMLTNPSMTSGLDVEILFDNFKNDGILQQDSELNSMFSMANGMQGLQNLPNNLDLLNNSLNSSDFKNFNLFQELLNSANNNSKIEQSIGPDGVPEFFCYPEENDSNIFSTLLKEKIKDTEYFNKFQKYQGFVNTTQKSLEKDDISQTVDKMFEESINSRMENIELAKNISLAQNSIIITANSGTMVQIPISNILMKRNIIGELIYQTSSKLNEISNSCKTNFVKPIKSQLYGELENKFNNGEITNLEFNEQLSNINKYGKSLESITPSRMDNKKFDKNWASFEKSAKGINQQINQMKEIEDIAKIKNPKLNEDFSTKETNEILKITSKYGKIRVLGNLK